MKPIIGITAFVEDDLSSRLNVAYSKSIIEAGGIPLIIPIGVEEEAKTDFSPYRRIIIIWWS